MLELVEHVDCKVLITLRDGRQIDISLATIGELSNLENYITDINIDESTNTQNSNPVGVVSSNTLKIVLRSNDRNLMPDNQDSPYYGLMDNTATVQVTLNDGEVDIPFNTFYVSNWVSNINSNNPYQVVIECTDLLAIINKNRVPGGEIVKELSTADAVKYVIESLNDALDAKYKIQYDEDGINFDAFPTLEYINIEATNMGTWFNTICQSTLTNIYIQRNNKLKTDYCLDDSSSESVCNLSDSINIISASLDKGGLVGYTAVKANYVINTINNEDTIAELTNQLLKLGENRFDNIGLQNKAFKITGVRVNSNARVKTELTSLVYNKQYADLVINSNMSVNGNVNIEVYGQTIKENKLFVQVSNGNSNEVLEVTNKLLSEQYINKFAQGLLDLISVRASTLEVTGFFNPQIQLGDIVYVDIQKSMNIKGYYKVIGLKWKITSTIRCTARLSKILDNGGE